MDFQTKLIFINIVFSNLLCENITVTQVNDNMVPQTTPDITGTVKSVTTDVGERNTQSVTQTVTKTVTPRTATITMTKKPGTLLPTGTRVYYNTQKVFTKTALRSTDKEIVGSTPSSDHLQANSTGGIPPPGEPFTFLYRSTTPLILPGFYFNPDLRMMEYYIKKDKTLLNYLAGFPNEYQRKVVETQLKICPYVSLCDFTPNIKTNQQSCCEECRCDPSCFENRTCCPSMLHQSFSEFSIAEQNDNSHASTGVLINKGKHVQQCISQHLTDRPSREQHGFYATAGCPDNVSSELRMNCTRPYTRDTEFRSLLPVFSNTTLEVFRNSYCAICNGINDTIYFQASVSCSRGQPSMYVVASKNDVTELVFATEECDMTFENVDTRIELSYCKYSISMCNVTGLWKIYDPEVEHACLVYRSLFRHEEYTFQNVFCALCNGMTPHTVTCYPDNEHPVEADIFSFSGLMKLDHDQVFDSTKISADDITQCSQNQIFDSLMEECKDLYCSQLKMLQGGTCVNIYELMNGLFIYNFYIRLIASSKVSVIRMFEMEISLYDSLQELFTGLPSFLSTCDFVLTFTSEEKYKPGNSKQLQNSELFYVDARIGLQKSSWQNPGIITTEIQNLHGTVLSMTDDFNVTTKFLLLLRDSDDRTFKVVDSLIESRTLFYSYNLTERVSIMSEYSLPSISGHTLIPSSVMLYVRPRCFEMGGYKHIDVLRFSSCPKVNVSRFGYPWSENNDGIIVGDMYIKSSEYFHIDQDHIMVCVDLFKKIFSSLRPDIKFSVEVIVSVTSSVLSLVALLVTILAYSLLPELRKTLAGKNSSALAISLFTAQIMLLVGSLNPFQKYSTECKVIGLIIHFSLLCSIFWMNVGTYHMFCVLSTTKVVSYGQGWKRFLYYNTYVLVMAVVFVATNVIISTSVSGQYGYGGKFCYITSQDSILFTFVLPTLLVICINLSMFLIVIIRIIRSSNIKRNVKNERNELVIFAKISGIAGITWIFGLLYTWTSIVAFSFIFIILNASQGVFMMFAFVVNQRVLSLCKNFKNSKTKTLTSPSGPNKL